MDIVKSLWNQRKQLEYKGMLLKSLRVGMFAFVASFLIALVISLVINVAFLTQVNEIVQGAIGTSDKLTLSGVMKTTSFIMNVSVFNRLANLKFGMLGFAIIPFLSFYFADRKDNKAEGMTLEHLFVYISSGLIFSTLSMLEAFLSKGELVGVEINFFTLGNFISTLVIAFLIQLVIGLNYNNHGLTGITAAKRLFWVLIVSGALASVVGMLILLSDFTVPLPLKLLAILIVIPNLSVYAIFTFMGTSISIGESLTDALALVEMDLSFGALPMWVKLLALLIFVGGICYSLISLNREKYFAHLVTFATSFSMVMYFAAYSTTINLGTVVVFKDVFIGVGLLRAFLIPFMTIMALGTLLKLIRMVVKTIKDLN